VAIRLTAGLRHNVTANVTPLVVGPIVTAHLPSAGQSNDLDCWLFRFEGDSWNISYDGASLRLRHLKGLRYLWLLLCSPGKPISVGDLAAERSTDPMAADAERARIAVTKRIREAIRRIAIDHPALGYHLTGAVRTGAWCCYAPDPGRREKWTTT
jgi:hypothetical protein